MNRKNFIKALSISVAIPLIEPFNLFAASGPSDHRTDKIINTDFNVYFRSPGLKEWVDDEWFASGCDPDTLEDYRRCEYIPGTIEYAMSCKANGHEYATGAVLVKDTEEAKERALKMMRYDLMKVIQEEESKLLMA